MGPPGRRLRLGRRLRRPPVVRGGHPRARARVARLPRRDPGPARLEERRRLARAGPPPALLRRERREHGLDDQPLHGEPEASQRRRLLAGRPHRAPARPADADLRAALPRGVPRRARGRSAASRRRCAASRTTTTGATWSGRRCSSRARPTSSCYGMGEAPIVRDRAPPRRGRAGVAALRDLRGVAYLLGRTETLPDHPFADAAGDGRTVELPSLRGGRRATRSPSRRRRARSTTRRTRWNARRLTQRHGDRVLVQNPPALPLSEARDGRGRTTCPTRDARTRATPSRSPRSTMIKDSVTIMRGCFGGCTFC